MSTSHPLLPRTTIVRIPLDYYQILGVAFSATSDQIQQSFEDRLQQLPKQQYSTSALAARKKLLQEAHSVLVNPKRRQEHDQKVFPNIENPLENVEPSLLINDTNKGIEIDADLLSGALIFLLEFGEFDSVLELGLEFLNREIDLQQLPQESGPADDDVALAVAIANLELGREHWQQGDCEAAGACLQTGLQILQDEDKYLDIQSEIETDLSKLRPYRVLNLFALDLDDPQRAEGFSLLQDMLDARGGLDGNGDDKSGLSVNDFLLFMQQLRDHLTVDEQFRLFHAESLRPSSVASYLSVYSNLARGVSEFEPDYISQGKELLSSLADRQDLSLEQGICSLLLGQPEAAVNFVQQSQDEEAIAYITESSAGAPDIIPGLYLYTEQWLQHEVFPYFRDLKDVEVSLEQYFNDDQVQAKLSALEPDLPGMSLTAEDPDMETKWQHWLNDTTPSDTVAEDELSLEDALSEPPNLDPEFDLDSALEQAANEASAPASSNWFSGVESDSTEMSASKLSWGQDVDLPEPDGRIDANSTVSQQKTAAASLGTSTPSPAPVKKSVQKPKGKKIRKPVRAKEPKKKPWVFWGAALLLGVSIVWGALAIGRLLQPRSSTPTDPTPSPAPEVEPVPNGTVDTPVSNVEEPVAEPENPPEATTIDQNGAQNIIQDWQTVKAKVLGKEYQVAALEPILMEPELSRWQYSANVAQDEGKYTQYQLKNLAVETFNLESPTVALVRAKIEETREDFSIDNPENPVASLSDSYKVDYRLELADGKWRIQKMDVVE